MPLPRPTHSRKRLASLGKAMALIACTSFLLILPGAKVSAEEERHCVGVSRALAFGSVAERVEAAETWRDDPAAFVASCRPALEEGFRADSRRFVAREPSALWRDENHLLFHLMHALEADAAEEWAPRLDTTVLTSEQIGTLAQYWMTSEEPPIQQAFALLLKVEDPAVRGEVLHNLLPQILDLEADSPTSAEQIAEALSMVGARRLVDDRQTAMLWPVSVSPRPHDAEAALLSGDLAAAFHLYAQAASTEPTYLYHTAILAEHLFQTNTLEPMRLIPLQISYSLCNRTYRVEQNIGAIYRLRTTTGDRELGAELALWQDKRCPDPRDAVEKARVLTRQLHERFPGTRAATRQQLIWAEALARRAEQLTESGRSQRANELRREALTLLDDPTFFRFPGGPTQARALSHSLLSALPAELDADGVGD